NPDPNNCNDNGAGRAR
ncbi:hypothetical protein A2U01_0062239, partial [Trifolium medium]|nr:hypothetical protein [Trifolium medium]